MSDSPPNFHDWSPREFIIRDSGSSDITITMLAGRKIIIDVKQHWEECVFDRCSLEQDDDGSRKMAIQQIGKLATQWPDELRKKGWEPYVSEGRVVGCHPPKAKPRSGGNPPTDIPG